MSVNTDRWPSSTVITTALSIVAAGRHALRDHVTYVFAFGGYDAHRRSETRPSRPLGKVIHLRAVHFTLF
jgi:hypothetical protein